MTSSDVFMAVRFSASDAKKLLSSNEVSFSPYIWLIVVRLIGIGSNWPSTDA
jgi:hypothetical protein